MIKIKSKKVRDAEEAKRIKDIEINIGDYEDGHDTMLLPTTDDEEHEYFYVMDYVGSSHTPFKMPVVYARKVVVK